MSSTTVFLKEQSANILTVVIIFLTLLTLFSIMGVNFNPVVDKHVEKVVTIESFGPSIDPDGGCHQSTKPLDIEKYCNSINVEDNCRATSCCVFLNGKKCVGGSSRGPTFHTKNGKDIDVKYYAYKDDCYGDGCSI